MELTRKEETRNKRISIAVTLFSFLVMLLFLIFKNIITPSPSFADASVMEVSMGTGNENGDNSNKKTPAFASAKQETNSQKKEIAVTNGEIVSVNKTGNTVSTEENSRNTETNLALTTGEKEGTDKPEGDAKFGFNIPGRTMILAPKFVSDTKQEGKVVVEIVVDKTGAVIEANPNGRGTNTNSAALKQKAKEMANATKFNVDERVEEQRGTITIIFSFN